MIKFRLQKHETLLWFIEPHVKSCVLLGHVILIWLPSICTPIFFTLSYFESTTKLNIAEPSLVQRL